VGFGAYEQNLLQNLTSKGSWVPIKRKRIKYHPFPRDDERDRGESLGKKKKAEDLSWDDGIIPYQEAAQERHSEN